MINIIKSFVGGWRSIAVSSVVALSVGLWGGWKAKAGIEAEKREKALLAQNRAHDEALASLQAELNAEAAERLRLSAELDAAQTNARTVTREIIREVPRYVQDSTPDCDRLISMDALRLLDLAARGAAPGPHGPETSASDGPDTLSGGAPPPGRYPPR